MSRITRIEDANGIPGSEWQPYRDADGKYVLGFGDTSELAKTSAATVTVDTEDEAVILLESGLFRIRMGPDRSLVMPSNILIDGQPVKVKRPSPLF
jgi:hypothetical protein